MPTGELPEKPRAKSPCDISVTGRPGSPPRRMPFTLSGALSLHLPFLLPLFSAVVYSVAALFIKLAMSRGASSWSVTFFSNAAMGLVFLPMLLFARATWAPEHLGWAIGAGALFFGGQIATFRALAGGDVSIATPALASKVVFVALLSLLVPGSRPDADLWLAVGLTMGGMLLLNSGPRTPHASRPLATVGWALLAASAFAAADILVQVGAPRAGFTLFMPVMFGLVALVSIPTLGPRLPRGEAARTKRSAWRWGSIGIALLALQATTLAAAIGIYGDAAGVNVVYGSRGLWSVLLVAAVAKHLGVAEGTRDPRTLLVRLAGSILILVAVIVVVL